MKLIERLRQIQELSRTDDFLNLTPMNQQLFISMELTMWATQ